MCILFWCKFLFCYNLWGFSFFFVWALTLTRVKHVESLCICRLFFEIMDWAANVVRLCNSITHQSIVLRSYPNPQKTFWIFWFAMKKILGFGFQVFCGLCHKWGRFRPFWLRSSGPGGANHKVEIFHSSFYWKLGKNLNLLSLWLSFYGFWFKSCYKIINCMFSWT